MKKKTPKTSVDFRYSHYHLTDNNDYMIQAKLYSDNTITLETSGKDTDFNFIRSSRGTIKAIGELLIEASKL